MSYYKTNSARKSLLGHLSFGVKDMGPSEKFYNAVLATFGIVQVYRDAPAGEPAKVCGWGEGDEEPFTLFESPRAAPHGARTHLAFNAPSRNAVDAFYAAALANGGKGNGEPGLRHDVGPLYYTAYICDPEGHRLEAVFQQPVTEQWGFDAAKLGGNQQEEGLEKK